eukprot:jgi/Bigna1/84745/fgenesh1_pg.274_\
MAVGTQETVTNVSRLLSEARAQLKFSVEDAIFGSYYVMALRRGVRRRNPDFEAEEHGKGVQGVISSYCPDGLLREIRERVAEAWFAYAPSAAALQWMARRNPIPVAHSPLFCFSAGNDGHDQGDPYEVVASSSASVRISKALVKPAYALLAHRRTKRLVITIRGTNSFEDVIVDARHKPVPFPHVEPTTPATRGEGEGASGGRRVGTTTRRRRRTQILVKAVANGDIAMKACLELLNG